MMRLKVKVMLLVMMYQRKQCERGATHAPAVYAQRELLAFLSVFVLAEGVLFSLPYVEA